MCFYYLSSLKQVLLPFSIPLLIHENLLLEKAYDIPSIDIMFTSSKSQIAFFPETFMKCERRCSIHVEEQQLASPELELFLISTRELEQD